ncbi:MAG: glycosyltransferase family 4 protein, partial [Ignavibacteria bacterium]
TKSYIEGNLEVIYFPYVSLPRPYFENLDSDFINIFFQNRLKKKLKNIAPDIICCHWIRPWAEVCSKVSKDLNVPFVIDHHEDIPTLKKLYPESYKNFLKIFEKANKIIVHSSVNKNDLEAEALNLNELKIIYLGQNFTVSEKPKTFNFKRLKLICVSHLYEPRKNIDVLIKAINIVRNTIDVELNIAGDGILKKNYEQLSESLGLKDHIKFTGQSSQKEVEEILERADIFILPSFPEAFGVVLTEALSKGLPVITCKGNGGGEELKLLNYPSILVNPGSHDELADAILNLATDFERLFQMSEKGKQIVRDHFTWKKNAASSFELFKKSINDFKTPV